MDPKFVERLTYALIAAIALAAGYFLKVQAPAQAPQSQPSVPSVIPPPCNGNGCSGNSCNPTRRRGNPFRVSCPNCRTTLNVQEPELGDYVPSAETVTPAAK